MEIKYDKSDKSDKSENQRLSSGQAPRPLKIEFSTHKWPLALAWPGPFPRQARPGVTVNHPCRNPRFCYGAHMSHRTHLPAFCCPIAPANCQSPISERLPALAQPVGPAPALPHPCSFLARPMWPICRQAKVAPRLSRLFEDRFRQIRAFRVSSPPHHLATT